MWTEIAASQHTQSENEDSVEICEIAISIHLFGRLNLRNSLQLYWLAREMHLLSLTGSL
jgi:hypothetical protein